MNTTMTLSTRMAHRGTPSYRECVELVQHKYLQAYGAVVEPMPDMFVMAHGDEAGPLRGRLLGVAGLTSAAGRSKLLSEHYLEVPAEIACARLASEKPPRRRICEMGSVASVYPGCGAFLMERVPQIASELGFEFLLSTLTRKLHGLVMAVGWDFTTLANARQAELCGVFPGNWGTYYETKPRTGILRCGRTISRIMSRKESYDAVA